MRIDQAGENGGGAEIDDRSGGGLDFGSTDCDDPIPPDDDYRVFDRAIGDAVDQPSAANGDQVLGQQRAGPGRSAGQHRQYEDTE